MLFNEAYVKETLALNLFFMRIMKEHLFFIMAALPAKNHSLIHEAEILTKEATRLLADVITLSNGRISPIVVDSGELVTEYTLKAEKETAKYTGIPIDTRITEATQKLVGRVNFNVSYDLTNHVKELNRKAIFIVASIIDYKEKLYKSVLSCKEFIQLYPSIIEHMIKEADLYRSMLISFDDEKGFRNKFTELSFWNVQMADHAKAIRGLLDPTEEELFLTANMFANAFELITLRDRTNLSEMEYNEYILAQSKAATKDIIDFKTDITEFLLECKIKAIILPLFADHVLREANHFYRILI